MFARLGEVLTLVPQRRTMAFLVVGATLVILIVASPVFIRRSPRSCVSGG